MAREVIIGRIGVKVTAELEEGMRRKLKRDLDKVEKSLGPLEIGTEADESGLQRDVRKIRRAKERVEKTVGDIKIGVEAEADLGDVTETIEKVRDAAKGDPIKVDMGVDDSGLHREVQASIDSIKAFIDDIFIDIHPNADPREVQQARDDIERELLDIRDLKIKLEATLDPASRRRVELQINELERRLGEDVDKAVNIDIDPASYSLASASLWALARDVYKTIFVRTKDVDGGLAKVNKQVGAIVANLTGSRLLWQLHKEKFEAFKNFDKVALATGTLATQFAVIGTYSAAFAGNILSVANDLGSIIGLTPVLISGLGAMAANAYIFKAAFSDFGERFPKIAQDFKNLEGAVNATFWTQAAAPFEHMIAEVFPQFEDGLNTIAESTGRLFGQMSQGIEREFSGKIGPIMDRWAQATDILGESMGSLMSILETTLTAGSKYLPNIANGFRNAMAAMDDWLQSAEASGELDQWIQRAMDNTKALGSVVVNTGRVLGRLGEYAQDAGAATLQGMAETMAGAVAIVDSADFEHSFKRIMGSVYAFTSQIGAAVSRNMGAIGAAMTEAIPEILGPLGGALSEALNSLLIGFTDDAFVDGIIEMFQGISAGLTSILPALQILGAKIGIVFGFVGGMFEALLPVIGSFITELAIVLTTIEAPVDGLLDALGPALASVVEGLAPLFVGIGEAAATLATNLTPVVTTIGELGPTIEPIAAAIGDFVATLAETLGPALPQIAEGFRSMLEVAGPAVTQLIESLSDFLETIQPIVDFVVGHFPLIGTVIGVVVGIVVSAVTGLIDGITSIIDGVKNIFGGLITFFTGLFTLDWEMAWEGIKQVATGIFEVIKGAILVWMNVGILGIVKGGLAKLLSLWKGGWAGIGTFLKGVWDGFLALVRKGLTNAGQAITAGMTAIKMAWQVVWNSIKMVLQVVWTTIKTNVSTAIATVRSVITGGINIIKAAWGNGWKAVITAVVQAVTKVVSTVREMPGRLRAIMSGAANLLVNAGRAIIDGFLNGLKSAWDGVVNFVTGIAPWIASHKGPVSYDRKILIPAGVAIMDGLVFGLEKGMPQLESQISRINDVFEKAEFSFGAVDTSELDRLERARSSYASELVTAGAQTAAPGMVNSFEFNMDNQWTPDDVSSEILYALRRSQRRGVHGREG